MIIDAAGDEAFFLKRILPALSNTSDEWDAHQLLRLLPGFARKGHTSARRALYDRLANGNEDEEYTVETCIVDLDGIPGLIRVAEAVGALLSAGSNMQVNEGVVTHASHIFGEDRMLGALRRKAEESWHVRAYLNEVLPEIELAKREATDPTLRTKVVFDIDAVLRDIEKATDPFPLGYAMRMKHAASAQDVETVFSRMLAETRRAQLICYLRLFRIRAMPRIDERVLRMALSDDFDLQTAALTALGHMQAEKVRQLALKLIERFGDAAARGVVGLFVHNYRPGDHSLIEAALPQNEDIHALHSIGHDVRALAEAQGDPELAGCLLWMYEHTPCSLCRRNAVKLLIERERAPEPLLEECVWDADGDTRKRAAEALEH